VLRRGDGPFRRRNVSGSSVSLHQRGVRTLIGPTAAGFAFDLNHSTRCRSWPAPARTSSRGHRGGDVEGASANKQAAKIVAACSHCRGPAPVNPSLTQIPNVTSISAPTIVTGRRRENYFRYSRLARDQINDGKRDASFISTFHRGGRIRWLILGGAFLIAAITIGTTIIAGNFRERAPELERTASWKYLLLTGPSFHHNSKTSRSFKRTTHCVYAIERDQLARDTSVGCPARISI